MSRSIVVIVAAALACAAPASAARPCTVPDRAKVMERSRSAVVWMLGKADTPASSNASVYGCFQRSSRPRRLMRRTTDDWFLSVRSPKLAGHFVGYVLREESEMDPPVESLRVVDLQTGRVVSNTRAATPRPPLLGYGVVDFVVRNDGAAAWIGAAVMTASTFGVPDAMEVHRRIASRADEILDVAGAALPPVLSSLALSTDGRTVFWLNAGQPRTAALR